MKATSSDEEEDEKQPPGKDLISGLVSFAEKQKRLEREKRRYLKMVEPQTVEEVEERLEDIVDSLEEIPRK